MILDAIRNWLTGSGLTAYEIAFYLALIPAAALLAWVGLAGMMGGIEMNRKITFDIARFLRREIDDSWGIYINRENNRQYYVRYPGSPSALRCARLLAKIAESEAKR